MPDVAISKVRCPGDSHDQSADWSRNDNDETPLQKDRAVLYFTYLPCSSARVTVVVSQTSEGPKYWIAPG